MNRILRINMTDKTIYKENASDELSGLGGRALIDRIMLQEVDPTTHPLSEDNKVVFAPGLFAGTSVPNSGRLSIGGKSPLTYGIKESNVGGTLSRKLARLRIKAVILEGKADDGTFVIIINKDGEQIRRFDDLKGLGNYAVCSRLRKEYGKNVGIASIGPCGEMMMSSATIAVLDMSGFPSRQAGRGGMGAVMGSKRIKAIIVDDKEGANRSPTHPQKFKKSVLEAVEIIKKGPRLSFFQENSTVGVISSASERGSMPTRNFRLGTFDKADGLGSERLKELNLQRGGKVGHKCMPECLVKCSNVFFDEKKQYLTSALEYETVTMLGANLEIDDIDKVAQMDRRCDDYGIDTIETGATLGVLCDETDLLSFGDPDGALGLIDEIGRGTTLGRVLGQGVVITSRAFGICRVPAVMGQSLPGHSAQFFKGLGVTYATSPQGADHTAGITVAEGLSPQGQVERSRNAQLNSLLMDSTGCCYYSFLGGDLTNIDLFASLFNALYGLNVGGDDLLNMLKTALKEEIQFNKQAGISDQVDRIPEFLRRESLPPTNAVFDVSKEEMMSIFDSL